MGGLDIRINVSQLEHGAADLRRVSREMRADVMGAVAQAEAVVLTTARAGAPVFTGVMANSIQATGPQLRVVGDGFTVTDIVQTPLPYAIVQEEGRRPGSTPPPFGPIRRWVDLMVKRGRLAIGDTGIVKHARAKRGSAQRDRYEGEIDSLAWRIRASIGKKGIPGKHFMAKAASAGEQALSAALKQVVARWSARFS